MKTIAIYNRKGGVGKTVSCVNIAGCLEKGLKRKVLIVDTDAQANATSYLMLHDVEKVRYCITDLFSNPDIDPDKIIYKAQIPGKGNERIVDTNIFIVPASMDLDNVSTDNMYIIRDFLAKVSDRFDFCILDCSPSVTEMTINALCAADYLMIPALAGRDSVTGYGIVMQEIDSMKQNGYSVNLKILGVFLNRVDKRRALEEYYREFWQSADKKTMHFQHSVRDASDIVNAQEFGKPIVYYRKCAVMDDYKALTMELIRKIKSCEKK